MGHTYRFAVVLAPAGVELACLVTLKRAMHGAAQPPTRFDYMEVVPADDAPSIGARHHQHQHQHQHQRERERACCCGYGRHPGAPRLQMMAFIVAQPVTTALWSWALHGAIAWIQVTFSSHSQLVNILLFYLAFSLLVIGLFPLGVIDLAAGFLFGAWTGFPVALATKTSGSVLCFILSRHTCSEYLRRTLVEHYTWLGALSLMMREQQFRTMALLRFSVLPAALKNYGCGSLSVSLRMFAGVTALALSLESFLLVPIGAKIDSLQNMMSREHTPQEKVALVLGVVLLLALMFTIRRTVRLQIEQIQRETAGRGGGAGPNGGSGDLLAERGSSDDGSSGGGGYAVLQPGKRAVVGDRTVMVEQTIL